MCSLTICVADRFYSVLNVIPDIFFLIALSDHDVFHEGKSRSSFLVVFYQLFFFYSFVLLVYLVSMLPGDGV